MVDEIVIDNPNGVLQTEWKYPYMNAWIDPQGNIYEIGYMEHEAFACLYVLEDESVEKEYEDSGSYEYGNFLFKKKWIKIMHWASRDPEVILGDCASNIVKMTKKQKDSLFDICVKYGSDIYKEFFKE